MPITYDNSDLVAQLEYTDKARSKIQDYSVDLSGRERQFLLLKMRNDSLSQMALQRIVEKIDVISLFHRGYLKLPGTATKEDNKIFEDLSESLQTSIAEPAEDDISTTDSEHSESPMPVTDPSIELLSGNVFKS